MGDRAECVMLNKGPRLGEAVQQLGDILPRMQAHQHKKSALLRPLARRGALGIGVEPGIDGNRDGKGDFEKHNTENGHFQWVSVAYFVMIR